MNLRKQPIKVGISYNIQTGGAAADSLRELINKSGSTKIDIDYYAIVSTENLGDIYADPIKMQKVYGQAKIGAYRYLDGVDCLIIPGNGAIVDPRLYDEILSLEEEKHINLRRAIAEMALVHVAMQKGMPILLICGGHHIFNVYLGGKLVDVSEESTDPYMGYSSNLFKIDSELGKIIFKKYNNNSMFFEEQFFGAHRQVVCADYIGGKNMICLNNNIYEDFLNIVSVSKNDGTVEAIEAKYGAPIYSLQFHPEVALIGMYSVLQNKIAYHSPNKIIFNANYKIIEAFKQAAQSYVAKKKINNEAIFNVVDNEPGVAGKNTLQTIKTSITNVSLFRDINVTSLASVSEDIDYRYNIQNN